MVLPTLLYNCGTWTVYQRDAKRLGHMQAVLIKLQKIKWQDRIPDTEVLKKGKDAECTHSSEIGTIKLDRPWYQIPDKRLPKKILF